MSERLNRTVGRFEQPTAVSSASVGGGMVVAANQDSAGATYVPPETAQTEFGTMVAGRAHSSDASGDEGVKLGFGLLALLGVAFCAVVGGAYYLGTRSAPTAKTAMPYGSNYLYYRTDSETTPLVN